MRSKIVSFALMAAAVPFLLSVFFGGSKGAVEHYDTGAELRAEKKLCRSTEKRSF